MPERKPQINFQVVEAMKQLYEEARAQGHWVTRFCAAGLLMMVEDPRTRTRAINRLREWESEFADAPPEKIREFIEETEAALRGSAESAPRTSTRGTKKKAKRG